MPAVELAGLAGLGFKPYDRRHTSATLLVLAGVNVKVVSQRLGHESIEITLKHYAHVLPGMQERARQLKAG
jgi:integrase